MTSRTIITFFAVLTVAGCARATEPGEFLEVSVALSSGVVRPGQSIDVTVTATNRGRRGVLVNAQPCQGAHGAFTVTNDDGELVGPGEMVCPLAGHPPRRLEPGEEIVFQSQWDGDAQRTPVGGPIIYLEAGEYLLRGQVQNSSGRAFSAPVPVRVVE